MPAARVNVPLTRAEAQVLIQMAQHDCRQPREQLRYLLRAEAERRGIALAEAQHKTEAPASNCEREKAGARSNR